MVAVFLIFEELSPWLYQFIFPKAQKESFLSTSSMKLVISDFSGNIYSDKYKVTWVGSFDWHLPDD